MLHRNATVLAAALVTCVTVAHAQAPAALPEVGPKVGEVAPDFSLPGATIDGVMKGPVSLSQFKGQTVVIAFFPKARTSGCTMQMHAYRDRYTELFKDGKKVTLVGVSVDPDSALTSWAKDDGFKFHFAADVDRKVGVAYGANAGTGSNKRHLYVIDPSGKISYVAVPFRQAADEAYTELGTAILHRHGRRGTD